MTRNLYMALAVPSLQGGGGTESRYLMAQDRTLAVSERRTGFGIQSGTSQTANATPTGRNGEDTANGNGRPDMTNRLRGLRSDQSWSQAELARRLGVSRQTVNALERGKYHPSLPLAFKIARLFDRPIEDVFYPQWDNGRPGD